MSLLPGYPLSGLLRLADLARSTFYYQRSVLQLPDKDAPLKAQIQSIYDQQKGLYGYRRITAVLRQLGVLVNHKVVQRLMKQESLIVPKPRKRRDASYLGEISPAPENIINRDFNAF